MPSTRKKTTRLSTRLSDSEHWGKKKSNCIPPFCFMPYLVSYVKAWYRAGTIESAIFKD